MARADRVATEDDAAGVRHVVHRDVGRLPRLSGDVGERDLPVEAVAEHVVPARDRVAGGGDVLRGDVGRCLDGHGQVGVVPDVLVRVEGVQDQQGIRVVGLREVAVRTPRW